MINKIKYLFNLFAVAIPLLLVACGGSNWTRDDKNELIDRCKDEGGSSGYCNCYLKNAMEKYPNAEQMDDIDFESAVELSINCK